MKIVANVVHNHVHVSRTSAVKSTREKKEERQKQRRAKGFSTRVPCATSVLHSGKIGAVPPQWRHMITKRNATGFLLLFADRTKIITLKRNNLVRSEITLPFRVSSSITRRSFRSRVPPRSRCFQDNNAGKKDNAARHQRASERTYVRMYPL